MSELARGMGRLPAEVAPCAAEARAGVFLQRMPDAPRQPALCERLRKPAARTLAHIACLFEILLRLS